MGCGACSSRGRGPRDPHAGHHAGRPSAPADPHAGHVMQRGGAGRIPRANGATRSWTCRRWRRRPGSTIPASAFAGNGRRVLTYADLVSTFDDPDGRDPSRTIELHLTGHMERFAWSFDGVKFSDAEPLRLDYGERVRIVLVNDTMMTHPIHLHGMWSDLEDEQGAVQGAQAHHRHAAGHAAQSTASPPTRSAAGPTTATCSSTWRPACSARCASRRGGSRERPRRAARRSRPRRGAGTRSRAGQAAAAGAPARAVHEHPHPAPDAGPRGAPRRRTPLPPFIPPH